MHSWFIELGQAIARADGNMVGFGIAALSASAAISSWQSWRHLHRARTIEDIPTARARSAYQGYVELEGTGRLMEGAPIIAPLSGLPCVWYRYRVERLERDHYGGRTRQRWVTVERGQSQDIFWLEDDTGRVVVDPEGAEITPKHKDVWNARPDLAGFARQPASVVHYLTSHPSEQRHRFTEERINPGDYIYAIGFLKNIGSHAAWPTVDEEVRQLLRAWKQDQTTLKQRFDLDNDGTIDQKEWKLARSQARREVLKERRQQNKQFVEGINVLARPADRQRPFLLSAYRQTHLIKRYRIWAVAYGAGFVALSTLAVWVFNTRFGN
ncbi:MAG: GIDE domain-containing protein [Acidiferrobacterales bacterium]|nr:GIDE domain-containing protein [Acidiferrobacterales bacterium]